MKTLAAVVYKNLIILVVGITVMLIFTFTELECPFLMIFGVPCPTCGSTRALVALLHLDFAGYVSNNVMALPLLIAMVVGLNKENLPINKKATDIFVAATGVVTVAVYIARMV